jgi:transcriptional regulator GlxA family with amidase domain
MPTQRAEHRRQIIAQFEEVARASLDKPVRLADLCRRIGVSPRALSRAFQAVGRTTPYRYIQSLRLDEVRQALLSDTETGTVTDIATRFGFRELGRFAVQYRASFGESPSETRRRARCCG